MASLAVTLPGSAQVPPALAQEPLRPLAVTQLEERQQGTELDNLRPLDITLGEPAPIVDLLLLLVRGTRISIVPDPDITGTFQGELKGVTLRQALEMILQPHGYDYSVQGNVVRVFKRRLETRRYDLNYVLTRRSGVRTLSASNGVTGSSTRVTSVDDGDVVSDLAAGVQTLLSTDGKFNMDKKAAMLQATDYSERLDQIQLYLDAVQHRAIRQVQIQAKVIEVVLSEAFSAGIDWNLVAERAGSAVSLTQRAAPASAGASTIGLNIKDFSGLLNALAIQGTVRVIASPTLDALNNEPAVIRAVVTTAEPQAITEGVVLSVTSQISGDGMINMSISPSFTERSGYATSRDGHTVPLLSVREADTMVRVHEHETIVISGLMDERLRPEPRKGVGRLFRGEVSNRRTTDLVILLTPTVMTPGMRAARD